MIVRYVFAAISRPAVLASVLISASARASTRRYIDRKNALIICQAPGLGCHFVDEKRTEEGQALTIQSNDTVAAVL